MTLGRFEVIHLGGMTIGRATYQTRVEVVGARRPTGRTSRCSVERLWTGCFPAWPLPRSPTAESSNSEPGDVFYIPPEPHDSWVVGVEPYVSLHFLGADKYTAK